MRNRYLPGRISLIRVSGASERCHFGLNPKMVKSSKVKSRAKPCALVSVTDLETALSRYLDGEANRNCNVVFEVGTTKIGRHPTS